MDPAFMVHHTHTMVLWCLHTGVQAPGGAQPLCNVTHAPPHNEVVTRESRCPLALARQRASALRGRPVTSVGAAPLLVLAHQCASTLTGVYRLVSKSVSHTSTSGTECASTGSPQPLGVSVRTILVVCLCRQPGFRLSNTKLEHSNPCVAWRPPENPRAM